MNEKSGAMPAQASMLMGAVAMCLGAHTSAVAAAPVEEAVQRGVQIEEIVVTARRREESLQSVPVSVSVLSAEDLRGADIRSINDLQYFVPSLNVNAQGSGEYPPVGIRGQGGYSPGGTAAVATYLNEVPLQSTSSGGDLAGGRYYDLQSVQVLKGPQGTLFGRNTTGGAILFETRRPTNDFEGFVEATGGNYDRRDVAAAVNLPVVEDKVLLRVAGQRLQRDGYARALSSPEHPRGLEMGGSDVTSGRVTLRLAPTDRLRNDTIYEIHEQETAQFPLVLAAVNPNGFANLVFPGLSGALAQQQALGVRTLLPIDTENLLKLRTWSATNILEYDLTADIQLRNIASYSKATFESQQDIDGTAFPIVQNPNQIVPRDTRQITEELQLQGLSLDGRLSWVGGAFFLEETQPKYSQSSSVAFGSESINRSRGTLRSKALYAQGTYDLSSWIDGLKFTAGYRYTWDERSLRQLPASGPRSFDGEFSAPTWTIGLDYQLDADTLLYLASRRGYRSGGFNPAAALAENRLFKPDYVTDLEAGVKSDWFVGGMRGRTNLAVYHQWYEKAQLSAIVVEDLDGQPSPQVVTSNAGEARAYGVELETQIHPTENLSFTAAASYFHQKFTELSPGVDPRLAEYVPKLVPAKQLSVGARYTLPLDPSLGEMSLSTTWNWFSEVNTSIDYIPQPYDTIAGYGLWNMNAEWNDMWGMPLDASVVVTNVADKEQLNGSIPLYESVGYVVATYTQPRMLGFRLRYRF